MKLKEFSGTDFYSFQGATNFPSGRKPMIADGKKATLIVGGFDSTSDFGIHIIPAHENDIGYSLGYEDAIKFYDNEERAIEDANVLAHLLDCDLVRAFVESIGFQVIV